MHFSEELFSTVKQMSGIYLIKDLGHRFQCLTDSAIIGDLSRPLFQ